MTIELHIPGRPVGKARPRFVKATGRTYTPKDTEAAEARVREAWRLAGSVDLGDGPLAAVLTIAVARPASHLRVHGGLTAAGTRAWVPLRKPDCDNALKLNLDALNGLAYRDDAQIVDAHVTRRWAVEGEREHTQLVLWPMEPSADVAAAIAALDAARERREGRVSRRSELHPVIVRMRREGLLLREIAERLDLSISTVHEYLGDPDGAKVRARKTKATCRDCETAIRSDRPGNPQERCVPCCHAHKPEASRA